MKRISAILLALVLCFSILAVPAFAAFDTVNSLAIVGSGIPGVGDWKPEDPAGDMTEVSDGIYEKVLTLPAGTAMSFKIAGNDTWDDTCNFGTGSALEMGVVTDLPINTYGGDMSFTASSDMTIKITVNLTGDTATILIENSDGSTPVAPNPPADDPVETPDAGEMVTIHAYVPDGISPKFWAWQNSTQQNAFESWPGNPMTKDGKWWTIQVPAWCDGMIVNDGGDKKTGDLTVEAGKEAWIVVQYDWSANVHYSEPKLDDVVVEAPPIDENPLFSRPTLGEKKDAATTTTASGSTVEDSLNISKKTQAIIVIATALLAIVALAFVLSIPKKMK